MSIDELTKKVKEGWEQADTLECWTRFIYLWDEHHGTATELMKRNFRNPHFPDTQFKKTTHYNIIMGTLDNYIDSQSRTFERYARTWAHYHGIQVKQ